MIHKNFPFGFLNIAGPAFAGKTTLIKTFRERFPLELGFSRSCTTRTPREGEIEANLYEFITIGEFVRRINVRYFLEWNQLKSNGKYYGTPWSEYDRIKNAGQSIIGDLDNNGSMNLKNELGDDVFNVYLHVTPQELYRRMTTPGNPARDNAAERLVYAVEETEFALKHEGTVYDLILNYDHRTPSEAIHLILQKMHQKKTQLIGTR